jgi:RNA polymerase sigma-70 factor, ECF subfamily
VRRNGLGRLEANTVRRVARRAGTVGARFFRAPLVPDRAFQDDGEPYPDHWRRFPQPWGPEVATPDALEAALAALPETWRRVVLRRDRDGVDDADVAAELGLTLEQERDVLARARAALRDRLDPGGGVP